IMPIIFGCPNCMTKLRIDDSKAGQTVACPKCKTKLRIPSPVQTAPATGGKTKSASPPPMPRKSSATKNPPKPPTVPGLEDKPQNQHTVDRIGSYVFGSLLLAFFVGVFVFAPDKLPEFKQRMLAVSS